jgi:hypothetical protein
VVKVLKVHKGVKEHKVQQGLKVLLAHKVPKVL